MSTSVEESIEWMMADVKGECKGHVIGWQNGFPIIAMTKNSHEYDIMRLIEFHENFGQGNLIKQPSGEYPSESQYHAIGQRQ